MCGNQYVTKLKEYSRNSIMSKLKGNKTTKTKYDDRAHTPYFKVLTFKMETNKPKRVATFVVYLMEHTYTHKQKKTEVPSKP